MISNMDIAGTGSVPAGEYDKVTIAGRGRVVGDIKSNRVDVSGMAKSTGKIETEYLNVSGMFKSFNDISVSEKLEINGTAKCEGGINSNNIEINGTLKVVKNITFDTLISNGVLTMCGECEGRKFVGNGCTNIDGLLSADIIELELWRRSTIKEIGGAEIRVRKRGGAFNFFKGKLISDVIEGDRVSLESTIAKVVRGHNIEIGDECKIEKIEYTGELNIRGNCTVKEKIFIK